MFFCEALLVPEQLLHEHSRFTIVPVCIRHGNAYGERRATRASWRSRCSNKLDTKHEFRNSVTTYPKIICDSCYVTR